MLNERRVTLVPIRKRHAEPSVHSSRLLAGGLLLAVHLLSAAADCCLIAGLNGDVASGCGVESQFRSSDGEMAFAGEVAGDTCKEQRMRS